MKQMFERVTRWEGNMEVKGKLIDGVTYVPVRDLVRAIKTGLNVTWSEKEGADVKL